MTFMNRIPTRIPTMAMSMNIVVQSHEHGGVYVDINGAGNVSTEFSNNIIQCTPASGEESSPLLSLELPLKI
jgi:hypothetical protein